MSYLLGIDIGTSGTKTLICDYKGKVKATAFAAHGISSPQPGWSEQDPTEWWQATCKATKSILRKAKVKADQVSAVGLSGQMHGSVFLADDEQPLRPALLWNDQRTAAECKEIEEAAGGRKQLIQMVGNPALTGFTAPKILWVRKHEPQVYEKTEHILLPKDYIRYCMTGEYATEVGDASGTLLLDVMNRSWNQSILTKLDINRSLLPDCHESHVVTGRLHASGAKAMGLKAETPVVGGSGDQPAGAIGNGIVEAGLVCATIGTSGVVFAHSDKPTFDRGGRVHTMCSAVAGKWCTFGCMLSAGGSLQWLRNNLGQAEVASAKKKKTDPYNLLVGQAAKVSPGCEGLFFLPYLTGERCPHADHNARGAWIGLSSRHGKPDMIRAVMEGVTYGMADILQIMTAMDIPIETVRLSGGGARSKLWRRLQADIYNKTVATINADEGPAYGAALLAGVGTGVWHSAAQACNAAIKVTETLKPDTKLAECYSASHRQYQKLYHAIKSNFQEIARLRWE